MDRKLTSIKSEKWEHVLVFTTKLQKLLTGGNVKVSWNWGLESRKILSAALISASLCGLFLLFSTFLMQLEWPRKIPDLCILLREELNSPYLFPSFKIPGKGFE